MVPKDFTADAPGAVVRSVLGHWTFVPNPLPPPLVIGLPLAKHLANAERFQPDTDRDRWVQAAMTVLGKIGNYSLTYSGGFFDRKVNQRTAVGVKVTAKGQKEIRLYFDKAAGLLVKTEHVLDDGGLRSLGRAVEILDCGCGASYLTLAVHHYLQDVLGIPAHIRGVDVNEELIRKSIERSDRLGAERLEFSCGSIGGVDSRADIVLALHACDTATDDAIAQAILGEARLLLSVPCCHHHLNDRLRAEGPAEVLRPVLRHGILQQRTADLVTDAFRALVLRIMGYRTDVVEFISSEHTGRNLMIRAVRGAPAGDVDLVHEYVAMRRFWGVTPYLEGVLGEPFLRLLMSNP